MSRIAETELRYRLLEPVRQYAQEKLFQAGKTETLRDRHQSYFQELAAQAAPHLRTHQQITWMRRLERELPNLRLALEWAYTEDGPLDRLERGLRLMTDVVFFWKGRNRVMEGRQWFTRLLDLEKLRRDDQPLADPMHLVRANALLGLVTLNDFLLGYDNTLCLEESETLFRQSGGARRLGIARIRYDQIINFSKGKLWVLLKPILAEFEALDDKFWMAECLLYMGDSSAREHEFQLAEMYLQRSLEISLEAGDWDIIPFQKVSLGKIAFDQGKPEQARDWAIQARESLAGIETDLLFSALVNHLFLGDLAWLMGDFTQAERDFQASIAAGERFQFQTYRGGSRLYRFWLSQGEYAKARTLINELIQSFSESKGIPIQTHLCDLADLEWGNGNYSQSRKMLMRYSDHLFYRYHSKSQPYGVWQKLPYLRGAGRKPPSSLTKPLSFRYKPFILPTAFTKIITPALP